MIPRSCAVGTLLINVVASKYAESKVGGRTHCGTAYSSVLRTARDALQLVLLWFILFWLADVAMFDETPPFSHVTFQG